MFFILCDICDSVLDMDYDSTMEKHLVVADYLQDSLDDSLNKIINGTFCYKCSNCDKLYSYTIDDVIFKFKERVKNDILKYRQIHIFRNHINPMTVNQDNGIIFCGNCAGIDKKGTCFKDIYKQCPYRKEA